MLTCQLTRYRGDNRGVCRLVSMAGTSIQLGIGYFKGLLMVSGVDHGEFMKSLRVLQSQFWLMINTHRPKLSHIFLIEFYDNDLAGLVSWNFT